MLRYIFNYKVAAFLALLGFALIIFADRPSFSAVSQNQFVTVQTPKFPKVQITNANNLTAQTLYACGTNGTLITGMWATSTDTSARDVQISVLNTSTYNLVTVNIAINAGSVSGTPPVNLMSQANWPGLPLDNNGNPYFHCISGDTLQAGMLVQLTSAKFMNVMTVASDF